MDIVKNKSSIADGSGTIIIAIIATTNKTILSCFDFANSFKNGRALLAAVFFDASATTFPYPI
jgi:hypothetical protein